MTAAQHERLSILMEEMAEALHIIGKIFRHGWDSSHPDYDNIPNHELLEQEIGHVLWIIDFMQRKFVGDLRPAIVSLHKHSKEKNALKFLHHQEFIDCSDQWR